MSGETPRVAYRSVMARLQRLGFEEYSDEMTDIINSFDVGGKHWDSLNPTVKGKEILQKWSVDELCCWINAISFLDMKDEMIQTFRREEVDGFAFWEILGMPWTNQLNLDSADFALLEIIRDTVSRLNDGYKSWMGMISVEKGVPCGVKAGIVADLSSCDRETAMKLVEADEKCSKTGIGLFYGQLVVLGYKEYSEDRDGSFKARGVSNDKFLLRRRRLPNGIKQVGAFLGNAAEIADRQVPSHKISISVRICKPELTLFGKKNLDIGDNQQINFEYVVDPSRDMFQIGRLESVNDFVVRGPLHEDPQALMPCGPVSRYSCRIECERIAPFRCFLFAAGFNGDKEIFLGETAPKWFDRDAQGESRWKSFDAMTTYGVRLWRPDIQGWCEISVQGRAYHLRSDMNTAGAALGPPYSNELVDGSIIDICGATFLFQRPKSMVPQLTVKPKEVIRALNALKPQCPVLLHNITFTYVSFQERLKREAKKLENSDMRFMVSGPLHVPTTDYSDVDEEHRSYVFPACGHVHGYHKSLEGRSCPLCRKAGPFVPIAFAFETCICSRRPTHVFNPCGHVASRKVCERWAEFALFDNIHPGLDRRPACPFCATALSGPAAGGPYNRLILQTETGEAWQSDDEEDGAMVTGGGRAAAVGGGGGAKASASGGASGGAVEGEEEEDADSDTGGAAASRVAKILLEEDQGKLIDEMMEEHAFRRSVPRRFADIHPRFPKYVPDWDAPVEQQAPGGAKAAADAPDGAEVVPDKPNAADEAMRGKGAGALGVSADIVEANGGAGTGTGAAGAGPGPGQKAAPTAPAAGGPAAPGTAVKASAAESKDGAWGQPSESSIEK